jgi:hypothetical protein
VTKLNSIRSYPADYNPPHLPGGLCTQQALADLLLHYLKYEVPAFHPPMSEEGIRRLIDLAFFASVTPEEGRFPRFRIACQENVGAPFSVARFREVEMDDVDKLRRLAPACTHPDCALLVGERDNRLWCDGIVSIGPTGYDTIPGRPEFVGVSTPPSLRIEVREPGHVIARSGLMAYELRAGKIRFLSNYWAVPGVRKFRVTAQAWSLGMNG